MSILSLILPVKISNNNASVLLTPVFMASYQPEQSIVMFMEMYRFQHVSILNSGSHPSLEKRLTRL